MAISDLSKFTVPLPGVGQSTPNQGLLMPKLKYRFRVVFLNFGIDKESHELTKQVMTTTRPDVSFENVELSLYNSKVNYAGRYTWQEVQIVLRDSMDNGISKLVGQQVQKQFDFFEQSSASSGADYKFTTYIEILDGGNGRNSPIVLERFELYGCYIQKVTYAQGDYKSSDPFDITLSLKYDNALQTDASEQAVGIGGFVGRTLGRSVLG